MPLADGREGGAAVGPPWPGSASRETCLRKDGPADGVFLPGGLAAQGRAATRARLSKGKGA